jgi:hypothetical protein
MVFMFFTIPKLSNPSGTRLINRAQANNKDIDMIDVATTIVGGPRSTSIL